MGLEFLHGPTFSPDEVFNQNLAKPLRQNEHVPLAS